MSRAMRTCGPVAAAALSLGMLAAAPHDDPGGVLAEATAKIREAPRSADRWYDLAKRADDAGYRARAFLSYVRFLTLEPSSPRAAGASRRLWDLTFEGVDPRGRGTLTISAPGPGADPWWNCSLLMSMDAYLRHKKKAAEMTDAAFFAMHLEGMAAALGECAGDPNADPFWATYVQAYLKEAADAGHLEAMAYFVRRSAGDKEVRAWIREHPKAVERFATWSAAWRPAGQEPR